MSRLTIVSGELSGTHHELGKGPVIIGRGHDCAIRLEDPLISRHHTRIFRSEGKWWIEDSGSRNRTFVNGQEVASPQILHRDDRVEIGGITLVFETEVDLLSPTWTDAPILSTPPQEESDFDDTVEPLQFRQQTFDSGSLEILYRVASIIGSGIGLPNLAHDALREVRTFFKADIACLFLTERVKQPIQPTLVLSDDPAPMVSQTVVLYTLQSRRAACIRDTRAELPASDVLNLMGEGKGRSLLCAPLLFGEKVFGAILVDYRDPNYFDHHALVLFTAIAHLMGNGIFQRQQIERLEATARVAGQEPGAIEALVGSSPALETLRQRIAEAAASDEPVLIIGERGTGKHEVARLIHQSSSRRDGPLVWLHALAEPPDKITALLLGVEKNQGQKTDTPIPGKLETAHGGTLVVEEIGALPLDVQPALLAYLKTLKFTRVGGQGRYFADTRLIATTSEVLEHAVAAGKFMVELFGAIALCTVAVPPLRVRGDDVIELATRYALQIAPQVGRREIRLAPPVLRALRAHRWPGNVRELRNAIERAVLHSKSDEITIGDLAADLITQVQKAVEPTEADVV
jgi:transcriptional regulator with GAF, ATPase, and Fis domain